MLVIVMAAVLTLSAFVVPVFATPTKPKLVVDVWWIASNDIDFRWTSGCWALDSGVMALKVWQLPGNSWTATKTYSEVFYTPKGADSPNSGDVTPITEPVCGYGSMFAQYTVTFTGTLKTGVQLNGFLGWKDYGGKVSDISISNNNNPPGYFDWRVGYFTGAIYTFQSDHWQYTLWGEGTARYLTETNAYGEGTPVATGDIVTAP